ncbi:MAG: hypothetical protein K0B02_04950 [DPANN group archaeon]|nr:hypothetical protein [DPANN group archaeon]
MTKQKKGAMEINTMMKIILVILGIGVLAILLSIMNGNLLGDNGVVSELANASNMTNMINKNNWQI